MLSGCCKHVAALLYFAASMTVSAPCTSQLQTWHQPSQSAIEASQPAFMRDINIRKVTAETDLLKSPEERSGRAEFDPRCPSRRRKRTIHDYNLDRLAEATNGNCGILRYQLRKVDDRIFDAPDITHIAETVDITASAGPPNIKTVDEALRAVMCVPSAGSMESEMQVTPESVAHLANSTVGQSSSPLWKSQRLGRLTSSKIGSCVQKVSDDMTITGATHSIIASVMGYYEQPDVPQLRWGLTQEKFAAKLYVKKQRSLHRQLKMAQTGLWISVESPFVAASPDGIVSCKCCGTGCLEVKCPWKYRNQSVSNYAQQTDSCLQVVDDSIQLKRTHPYYAQVQTHMYCTHSAWCDFVVYTAAKMDNILVLRVDRDEQYTTKLAQKAAIIFSQCIIPELKSRAVQQKVEGHYVQRVMENLLTKVEQQTQQSTQQAITGDDNTSFLCGGCSALWLPDDKSIQCNQCQLWYHYKCAEIKGDEDFLFSDVEWDCVDCCLRTVQL